MRYVLLIPWELRDTAGKAKLLEPYAFDHALLTGEPQPSRVDPDIWVQIGERRSALVSAGMLSQLDQVC